jgi:hypothetical protein
MNTEPHLILAESPDEGIQQQFAKDFQHILETKARPKEWIMSEEFLEDYAKAIDNGPKPYTPPSRRLKNAAKRKRRAAKGK